MYFLIILGLGLFIGYKLRGAIEIYRQVKQVKSVEKIVERVISNKEIRIINEFRKNNNNEEALQ